MSDSMTPAATRVYRTVYRRQRDIDRFPDADPAQLPVTVYSSSANLDYQQEDLAYLRRYAEQQGAAEAWIETRIEHPWERTR